MARPKQKKHLHEWELTGRSVEFHAKGGGKSLENEVVCTVCQMKVIELWFYLGVLDPITRRHIALTTIPVIRGRYKWHNSN